MFRVSFIDACLNGDALLDEIDDYIDEWHEGEYSEEIYEFLGMTQDEYRLWVEDESFLKEIIRCHMNGTDINEAICNFKKTDLRMVARAKDENEAKLLYKVIEKYGEE